MFSTWHIIRAAGLTSFVLLFLLTACGLLLSTGIVPVKYRASILKIHATAASACIFFSVIHMATLLLDKYVHFSLADILLPFWAEDAVWETATGIIAFYALLIITITSVSAIMKLLGAKLWRFTHYLAFPCFWLSLYHSLTMGTDSNNPFIILLYAVTAGAVALITLLRIIILMRKRRISDEHSACGR